MMISGHLIKYPGFQWMLISASDSRYQVFVVTSEQLLLGIITPMPRYQIQNGPWLCLLNSLFVHSPHMSIQVIGLCESHRT